MREETITKKITLQAPGTGEYWNCSYIPDIIYCERDGVPLRLQLILPQRSEKRPALVIYIQGSGWGRQDVYTMIPQLCTLAAAGFAVAGIEVRDSGTALFPACLEDAKEAVRFLRKKEDTYGYDASRIGAWGTSSGGHLVAMLGLTAGSYRNGNNLDVSDAVQAVVDCYGPTDLLTMDDYPGIMSHNAPDSPESCLIGGPVQENREKAIAASPLRSVPDAREIPPFLILHGTADDKVPKEQSIALWEALQKAAMEAELILIDGAGHGNDGGVIGAETLKYIKEFYRKHLNG